MVVTSPAALSSDFPNLQELFHHVGTIVTVETHPPEEMGESADFSTLSHMAAQLQTAGDHETEETPAGQVEENLAEPEFIAPWAAATFAEPAEPTGGLTQATESIAHDILAADAWDEIGWEERGVGLVFGGAVLILLAVLLACCIPGGWVTAVRAGSAEFTRLAWVRTWLCGLPALALAVAGVGSLQRRRWSVPLVHAGGWFVAMAALLGLAVATGGMFLILPASGKIEPVMAWSIGQTLLVVGIFGVALPLGMIAIYQRRYLPQLCQRSDPQPRWTDGLPEPLLMLWLSCWLGLFIVGTLLAVKLSALPLAGEMLTAGTGTRALFLVLFAGFLLAQQWVVKREKRGWWLVLLLFTFMVVNAVWTFWSLPWTNVLQAWGLPTDPVADAAPSRVAALVAVGLYVPQLMVLLMARGCFPKQDDVAAEAA